MVPTEQKLNISRNKYVIFLLLIPIFAACAGSPSASGADELDTAIRETSDYLNNNIVHGNKLVILNVQSNFPALSEYIIDELTANIVNDRVFTVVDRVNLSLIQQETAFQMSGEVNDETAVSIGQKLGAQTIVSGTVAKIGDLYRLRVRALDVTTAQIQGQFNRNIPNGKTVTLLADSKPTGGTPANTTTNMPSQNSVATTQRVVTTQPAATVQNIPAYKIGDTGPAGGLIFYDKGNSTGGWRYLEVAPPETETLLMMGRDLISSQEQRAGFGKENTQSIMKYFAEKGGEVNTAAWKCDNLMVNNFDDWYLPSSDELMYIYVNLHSNGIGNFNRDKYWSSTHWGFGSYYYIDFNNGERKAASTSSRYQVRAVRRF